MTSQPAGVGAEDRAQCARTVLMVRPAAFGANPETAASNAFQSTRAATEGDREAARREFDAAVAALERAGVEVIVADDTAEPAKPDAVFPNNWLGLQHDGTAVLYPMLSPRRRLERRRELLGLLEGRGFAVRRVLDLTHWESSGVALEGTGSMVLDHPAGIAYACVSPRTDARPLAELGAALGYRAHVFHATGPAGEPVYHTNVLLCLGERFAVACLEAVADAGERTRLRESLAGRARELLELTRPQMNAYAGNMLALSAAGEPVIALSTTAWAALTAMQRRTLEAHGTIVTAAVPTIERFGGGSLRCMLAEVFLPRGGEAG